MPRTTDGWTGFHGTSLPAAIALLNGGGLDLAAALENKIDGPLGFYLAEHPDVAAFFAVRRAPGAVLRYDVVAEALAAMMSRGAVLGPIPQGGFPTAFPGNELFVPPDAFQMFNRFRQIGAIEVTPYKVR